MYLLCLALAPAILILVYIYKKDKVEPEPVSLIIQLLLLGLASVAAAVLLGIPLMLLGNGLFSADSVPFKVYEAFVVAALAEEGSKLFMLKIRTWKSPHFNYVFDAIVYAVTVSLGFAAFENLGYVLTGGSVAESYAVAFFRGLLAVPGHAVNGVFMGFWYGIARERENAGLYSERMKAMTLAFWVPALMHGFYDYCLLRQTGFSMLLFFVYEIVITIFAIRMIHRISREDRLITAGDVQPGYPQDETVRQEYVLSGNTQPTNRREDENG